MEALPNEFVNTPSLHVYKDSDLNGQRTLFPPQLSSELSQPKRLSVSKSQYLISLSEQGMTLEDLSFLTQS